MTICADAYENADLIPYVYLLQSSLSDSGSLYSRTNGSNIFGTMENCSRDG